MLLPGCFYKMCKLRIIVTTGRIHLSTVHCQLYTVNCQLFIAEQSDKLKYDNVTSDIKAPFQ